MGLASTSNMDQQGEIVDLKGLDLTPIKQKRGIFNLDHKKSVEDVVGSIDTYKIDDKGLWLGGYLFKQSDRARAIYNIMNSLKKEDRGKLGMSLEGSIKERGGPDGKVIKRAVINACALTFVPVNSDTYVDLVKSLSGTTFESTGILGTLIPTDDMIQKALGVGSGYATETPGNLSGGDALAQEDLDHKPKDVSFAKNSEDLCADCCAVKSECSCPKGLKKMSEAQFRKSLETILFQLSELYPHIPKDRLWDLTKERINRRFPPADLT